MKWLVIYFYLSGVWIAGDFVHPEGWSSIQYATEKECIEHMGYANENLQKSDHLHRCWDGKCRTRTAFWAGSSDSPSGR